MWDIKQRIINRHSKYWRKTSCFSTYMLLYKTWHKVSTHRWCDIRSSIIRKKLVILVRIQRSSAFVPLCHKPHSPKVCESWSFSRKKNAINLIPSIYSHIQPNANVANDESHLMSINKMKFYSRPNVCLTSFQWIIMSGHSTGHLFTDNCQALLEIEFRKIDGGIYLVNSVSDWN